ncbi:MAG: xanthine dehydrogenase family protein molybdopterin-binding subunit [Mariprofundaceae bacterium]|nr:xanthine dehydrogenase family protein molybdopterin-binding subunit [Mariprofundaceae bacterium]
MAGWKSLKDMTVLSKPLPRLDGPDKVAGQAKYTHDMHPKGLLYAGLLVSPHPAARVVKIDASKVRRLPGVKAVLTDVHPTGTVRYAGEEIAAVAATSPEVLEDALELFEVEYETLPFVADIDSAMQENAPRVFANRPNIRDPRVRGEGDVDAGFARADAVVESEYRTQVQTHSTLETHGSMVYWEGDELVIYDSTQAVHGVREGVAKFLDMPVNKVRVVCKHMGAGFGSKLQPGRYTAIAARLAKETGAPVKLMLTRKQDFLGGGNRPNSISHVKLAATKDGKLTAFYAKTYGTAGIGTNAGIRLPFIYTIPNWKHEHYDVFTNAGPARAFRAPGCPQASFVMEQLMDELAEKLNMDPLEFRLKNDSNATRQKEWRLGAKKFGWQRRHKKPGADTGRYKRGMGLAASIWWPGGRGTKATMTIYPDGTLDVKCGTQDIGTGTRTYMAMVAAEELGIPMKRIRPMLGDSNFPKSGASGGSTTTPSVGPAIKNTSERAKTKLMDLAAQFLGVPATDLAWDSGTVYMKTNPVKKLTWDELCQLLGTETLEVHGQWVEGLSSRGVAGCQFAEVTVDTWTGQIQVNKIVAVADCGLILNRLTTESQVNGAILQGISYALLEERHMDPETGTMVNANYGDYKILGAKETPAIEVIFYDEPERGVIGIGEPPTIPTNAAIANAVYNATGVRMYELPMTPDRVLTALEAHQFAGKED